ncbi:hypothetical protein BH10PSE17_BH10PSE17_19950 [soil metagenome]
MDRSAGPTLLALSALLSYPDDLLRGSARQLHADLAAANALSAERMAALDAFAAWLGTADSPAIEAEYLATFGSPTHLLRIFSAAREPASVREAVNSGEVIDSFSVRGLPDHLPSVLDFISVQPVRMSALHLQGLAIPLRCAADALTLRRSRYACVIHAVMDLIEVDRVMFAH